MRERCRRDSAPWRRSLEPESCVAAVAYDRSSRLRFCGSDCEAFGVGALEFQAMAGPRQVGTDHSVLRHRGAVEQHPFDAYVIVKPFNVAKARGGAADMQVQRRRG